MADPSVQPEQQQPSIQINVSHQPDTQAVDQTAAGDQQNPGSAGEQSGGGEVTQEMLDSQTQALTQMQSELSRLQAEKDRPDYLGAFGKGLLKGVSAGGANEADHVKDNEKAAAGVGDFVGTAAANIGIGFTGPAAMPLYATYWGARELNRELDEGRRLDQINVPAVAASSVLGVITNKLPPAIGKTLLQRIMTGSVIGGVSSYANTAIETAADNKPINLASQDMLSSALLGAGFGGALPVGHVVTAKTFGRAKSLLSSLDLMNRTEGPKAAENFASNTAALDALFGEHKTAATAPDGEPAGHESYSYNMDENGNVEPIQNLEPMFDGPPPAPPVEATTRTVQVGTKETTTIVGHVRTAQSAGEVLDSALTKSEALDKSIDDLVSATNNKLDNDASRAKHEQTVSDLEQQASDLEAQAASIMEDGNRKSAETSASVLAKRLELEDQHLQNLHELDSKLDMSLRDEPAAASRNLNRNINKQEEVIAEFRRQKAELEALKQRQALQHKKSTKTKRSIEERQAAMDAARSELEIINGKVDMAQTHLSKAERYQAQLKDIRERIKASRKALDDFDAGAHAHEFRNLPENVGPDTAKIDKLNKKLDSVKKKIAAAKSSRGFKSMVQSEEAIVAQKKARDAYEAARAEYETNTTPTHPETRPVYNTTVDPVTEVQPAKPTPNPAPARVNKILDTAEATKPPAKPAAAPKVNPLDAAFSTGLDKLDNLKIQELIKKHGRDAVKAKLTDLTPAQQQSVAKNVGC